MADLFPVAGAKIYIGGVKATSDTDFIATDFTGGSPAITWTEIDGWEQCGSYGDNAQVITTALINRGRDVKQKGTKNAGQMQNVFSYVQGDAGQAALIAAAAASDNYAFKIVYDDIPTSGTTGTTHYFVGLVMNANHAGGSANTVRNLNSTIEVNSNIVEVAAA